MKKLSILSISFAATMLFAFANVNSISAQEFNIKTSTVDCLDVVNNSMTNNVRINTARCDPNSVSQKFTIVRRSGTGFMNIQVNGNLCMEISNGDRTDDTDVTQFSCDQSNEQAFRFPSSFDPTRKGSSTITGEIGFSHSGKCFDTQNFQRVQQFTCNGSRSQQFEFKEAQSISPDVVFLNTWSKDVNRILPLTVGDVELLSNATTNCKFGCDRTGNSTFRPYLAIDARTPKLFLPRVTMNQLLPTLKPTLVSKYCTDGGGRNNVSVEVSIRDAGRSFIGSFIIDPSDCSSIPSSGGTGGGGGGGTFTPPGIVTPPGTTGTTGVSNVEQMFWDAVKSSTNPRDYQSYLDNYPKGNYAPLARLGIIRNGGTPTNNPTNSPGTFTPNSGKSVEDQYWDSIKSSKNAVYFQTYLRDYPRGQYAPLARLELSRLPNTPTTPIGSGNTPEDQYWNRVKSSTRASDYQAYLNNYPNGKYVALARLGISQNPTQQSLEDNFWDSIKTSNRSNDYQSYLNKYPRGTYVKLARQKKEQIEQKEDVDNFVNNSQSGSLGEIANVRKVFITASDFNSRSRIVRELEKETPSVVIVNNKQSADFFIEYKSVVSMDCDPGTSTATNACELHTGRLWLHTITNRNVNRILWTTTKTKAYSATGVNLFTKNPAAQAADDLAKDLKNMGF